MALTGHSNQSRLGWLTTRPLSVGLLCFALSCASFLAAITYAVARIGVIADLTSNVSHNAMPSVACIGSMRYQLINIDGLLDSAIDGDRVSPVKLEDDLLSLENARRCYEALPQFPAEPAVWTRAGPLIAEAERAATQVMSDVQRGDVRLAEDHYKRDYRPIARTASSLLRELRRINLDEGVLFAAQAEHAMQMTAVVSFVLGGLSAVFTAALAWVAGRSSRRALLVEARRAEELDAFAARVAHDLRGPLSAPLVVLQRLRASPNLDAAQKLLAERGTRSLQRADQVIGDLLTFARAGAASDPNAHAFLPEAVSGALHDVEAEATAAQVYIVVDDLPKRDVCCTPGVLTCIVENLVNNAIKYMPRDHHERRVTIRAADSPKCVRVEVTDTGAGVPDDAKRRIFEPYVRMSPDRPGLGLGLATVKRLVESHGGTVGVQSSPRGGSAFWFELPARAA